jgi:hypothetical protein
MDGNMQPSEGYAQVEEEIGSQEVEVEEIVDDALECVQVGSSTCHYFVDVDEEDNHTRGTPHKDIRENPNFEEASSHHELVEKTNIAKFLTLPLIPAPTAWRQSTFTPIIDYSKSWIMTNDEYLAQLEQRAQLKDEVEVDGRPKKEVMERSKLKRQAEKQIIILN